MSIQNSRDYPSKLLLFGEYAVIHGGDSIAIPFHKLFARWRFVDKSYDLRLQELCDFLSKQKGLKIDLERFQSDIFQGIYLDSSIPIGYGAGSSGSVVAAVYDRYGISAQLEEPNTLKQVFSVMESHFHGSSSGLDPLVSFLNEAVHIEDSIVKIEDIQINTILKKLFIYDSGLPRSTGSLVKWYKEKIQSSAFVEILAQPMANLNKALIRDLLDDNEESFLTNFQLLSELQQHSLEPMFPLEILEGLRLVQEATGGFVKLCGAGGGGFYLFYLPEPRNIVHLDELNYSLTPIVSDLLALKTIE